MNVLGSTEKAGSFNSTFCTDSAISFLFFARYPSAHNATYSRNLAFRNHDGYCFSPKPYVNVSFTFVQSISLNFSRKKALCTSKSVSQSISPCCTDAKLESFSNITSFSNYGNINVDIFAPGYKIYSTVTNNSYEFFDGTSMATPNVSGIASVLLSFYPKYSASKIKEIILESGIQMYSSLKIPSSENVETSNFFSKTGKLVNLYNALLYASK